MRWNGIRTTKGEHFLFFPPGLFSNELASLRTAHPEGVFHRQVCHKLGTGGVLSKAICGIIWLFIYSIQYLRASKRTSWQGSGVCRRPKPGFPHSQHSGPSQVASPPRPEAGQLASGRPVAGSSSSRRSERIYRLHGSTPGSTASPGAGIPGRKKAPKMETPVFPAHNLGSGSYHFCGIL